ncbi:MAG: DUF805 domain-containing protein [Proteobacteria bacterium]|nr:DUF805 domain-containing protein [Pseudomonadota bacterium]
MDTFKKVYLRWNGRITRKTYWIFSIPVVLFYLCSVFIIPPNNETFSMIILLLVLYPSFMINIKRAHDRDRTGWFTLLLIVPIISLWPLIELGFLKGSDGSNRYGSPGDIWTT